MESIEANSDESKVLNVAIMKRLLQDTSLEFLSDLIEVFNVESVQRFQRIQFFLAKNDLQSLMIDTHSLKGTSVTFGAEVLCSLIERIESGAARGDGSAVSNLVEEADSQLRRLRFELTVFAERAKADTSMG
jgi:HPt (histidine-containing phosphotransfer) domain-containing protein